MTPEARRQAVTAIASLERQIAALQIVTGHQTERDSCQRAIDRLTERLEESDSRVPQAVRNEQSLRVAMSSAWEQYREARDEFQRLISDVPQGIGSDGTLMVKQAGQKRTDTMNRYREAVARYNEFIKSNPDF